MNGRQAGWGTMTWGRAAILTVVAAAGRLALAQTTVESLPLARTYGSGVHAYFVGDYERSYDDLTAAIEAGSEDPRAHYFRGLAALRLGRLDEAEADFSAGADLEARALGGWPVSRSLERVQGHDRLRLEKHRSRARVVALQRGLDAERTRYTDTLGAQDNVRRRLRPTTPASSGSSVTNLFDGKPEGAAAPTPAKPVEESLPAPRGAAAPEESPVEAEPSVDPFGPQPDMGLPPGASAVPADAIPAEEPVVPADMDPFGNGSAAEPVEAESPAPDGAGQ